MPMFRITVRDDHDGKSTHEAEGDTAEQAVAVLAERVPWQEILNVEPIPPMPEPASPPRVTFTTHIHVTDAGKLERFARSVILGDSRDPDTVLAAYEDRLIGLLSEAMLRPDENRKAEDVGYCVIRANAYQG